MAIRAILPVVLLGALGATSQTRDPLDDLFARGRAMQATLHSVSASFTETTVSSVTESAASFGLFMAISVHKRPPLAKTRRTAAPFHESLSTCRPKCRTAG